MLDQMFTAENFRRIFDIQNRKGKNLASQFFPQLAVHTDQVQAKQKELRTLRTNQSNSGLQISPESAYQRQVGDLQSQIAALKVLKSAAIDAELELVSARVIKANYRIELSRRVGPKGKLVFSIDETPETYFVVKQLQYNLHKIYNVKQANRHDLICRVRDTVSSGFPYELVRTDIESFYESINRKELVSKLENDQLLSASSKKFVKQILESYGQLASTKDGIPRGVGISAYLAELYLRPVDKNMSELPGLVLYCRYVDDIVAVFARPPAGRPVGNYRALVSDVLTKSGLTPNETKTRAFDLAKKNPVKFEYLGYRFHIADKVAISPSAAKVRKYKARLNAAFNLYAVDRSKASRRAYRALVGRVKFLTGNTRLLNSKSTAVTGIFYNNSLVSDVKSFRYLDKLLRRRISELNVKQLKKRLKIYKFETGFVERRFFSFSVRELQSIVRAWKND